MPCSRWAIVPVGVTEWFGGHPSATWPWAQDELAALGGTPPEVVGEAGTINYERIAALRPDVILALYAGLTEDDYATLAQIAPTVAQPAGYVDYGIPWDELTRTVGSVVGREQQAGALIAEIEDDFAAARAEHPEFTGATAVVASPYEGTVSVYAPQDARAGSWRLWDSSNRPRSRSWRETRSVPTSASNGSTSSTSTRWSGSSGRSKPTARGSKPNPCTPASRCTRRAGRCSSRTRRRSAAATSFVTVLSLPLLIDELVPMLAHAVDGDPSTG